MIPDSLDNYVVLCEMASNNSMAIYATFPTLEEARLCLEELRKFHEDLAAAIEEQSYTPTEQEYNKSDFHPVGIWKFTRVM